MKSVKNLLDVLMDGIKDSWMWIDFAREAMEEEKNDWASWFKSNAKKRIESLDAIYTYVSSEIGMEEKKRNGDELACAMIMHVEDEIDHLHKKINSI